MQEPIGKEGSSCDPDRRQCVPSNASWGEDIQAVSHSQGLDRSSIPEQRQSKDRCRYSPCTEIRWLPQSLSTICVEQSSFPNPSARRGCESSSRLQCLPLFGRSAQHRHGQASKSQRPRPWSVAIMSISSASSAFWSLEIGTAKVRGRGTRGRDGIMTRGAISFCVAYPGTPGFDSYEARVGQSSAVPKR